MKFTKNKTVLLSSFLVFACFISSSMFVTADMGSAGVNDSYFIPIHESQLILYDTVNIATDYYPLYLSFPGWNSQTFDIKVSNIHDNDMNTWDIQNNDSADYGSIPVYGCEYTEDETHSYRPQELGTNFHLTETSFINNLYLQLSFNIKIGTDENFAEMCDMIETTSIDVRRDNGYNAPEFSSVVSIPLRGCIITWDINGSSGYVGKTIGNAIDLDPKSDMLEFVIIRAPVNVELTPGNYWTVFSSTTYHELSGTAVPKHFNIMVYAYKDGDEDSQFLNRTVGNNYWSAEHSAYGLSSEYDMYQVIEVSETRAPNEVGLKVNGHLMDSTNFMSLPLKEYGATTITFSTEMQDISFCTQVDAYVEIDNIVESILLFSEKIGNMNIYSGILPLGQPHHRCDYKTTSFWIPEEWDPNRLEVFNQWDQEIEYTTNGHEVIIANTEAITEIHFKISIPAGDSPSDPDDPNNTNGTQDIDIPPGLIAVVAVILSVLAVVMARKKRKKIPKLHKADIGMPGEGSPGPGDDFDWF